MRRTYAATYLDERPESAHLARCLAARRRSVDWTDNGRPALAAGIGHHAP